ncbi:uncharacterized protein LOC112588823 [Harpegnathos saltator]|uniref:uncharacterized protein LOC112588823 n=1 Tax=Harpegnathos saltator TaxID=610380 RepID=UPI000DBEF119|nr:uncharacterized protein LOC112588823 [Harpegnathos saltator]
MPLYIAICSLYLMLNDSSNPVPSKSRLFSWVNTLIESVKIPTLLIFSCSEMSIARRMAMLSTRKMIWESCTRIASLASGKGEYTPYPAPPSGSTEPSVYTSLSRVRSLDHM